MCSLVCGWSFWSQEMADTGLTDQFVLFDKATELSAWNQLAPLSQHQLRSEDQILDKSLTT